MGVYINGIGSISAQLIETRLGNIKLMSPISNRLFSVEPDYSNLVSPMQLRRMSKVVRMGVASAKQALKDAGLERPEMITIGTAYGCLADTENFLGKLLTQEETMLTPTAFIQSTHNTVSGQIALMTQCYGHNFTYVHKGHSFESSFQEAMLWMKENEHQTSFTALTGGIDELTNDSFDIISRFGTYKNENQLNESVSEGTIAGEGANFFILGNTKGDYSYAECADIHLCSNENIQNELSTFLKLNNLTELDIDTCFLGVNGDSRYDEVIIENMSSLNHAQFLGYKKWCGEYPTSNAFAVVLACMLMKNETLANELALDDMTVNNTRRQNVLIYNHYKNKYHSFILLRKI